MTRTPDQVIDIPEPRGLQKRLERLFIEYSTKAAAIRLTADVLAEDDRRQAREVHPKKLLAAMQHRNGSRPTPTPKTKLPISGKRMSLFVLEHLDQTKPIAYIIAKLTAAGSPPAKPNHVNGSVGGILVRLGYVKKIGEGFRVTSKGTRFRERLRAELEAQGKVIPGGYLEPKG